jgi:hypothetical protein
MMNWHYADNGKQIGPVTEEQLWQLFKSGQINADTPVWREGMAGWVTYHQAAIPPHSPAAAPPPLPPMEKNGESICAGCGQYYPDEELLTLNKTLVCAQCKPLFLQRMAEGLPVAEAAGLWREGNKLVTRSGTSFPDRCVKCNAPANGFRLKRALYWYHPAYYLLLLLFYVLFICSVFVLVVVLFFVRKHAVVHVGLCEAHRKQRQTAIIICTIGVVGGLAMIIGGIAAATNGAGASAEWVCYAGIVIFLAGAIWGIVKARTVYASKIDKNTVWVSGVCQEFLDQLPTR